MNEKDKKRMQRNKDLLERVKEGHDGRLIDQAATFFPPRKIYAKDKKAIDKIFKKKDEKE